MFFIYLFLVYDFAVNSRDFCFYTKKLQKNFRSESLINIDFLKIIYIFLYFYS